LELITATEFDRGIDVFDASVCARVIGNDPLFDLIIANCSSSFLEPIYAVLFDSFGTKPSFK